MDWKNNALKLLERSLAPIPQELNELDWKSGLSPEKGKLAKHICAFANHPGGGTFAFGIRDKDASFINLGKDDIEAISNRLANIAGNSLSVSINLEHDVQEYKGHGVLFVHVPEQQAKPVHLRGKLMEAYWRSAGRTEKMTENQVRIMLAQTQGLEFEERLALEHLELGELLRRLEYKTLFERLGEDVPSTPNLIAKRMQLYGLCREERDSLWAITNLGAILFASDLEDFPHLHARRIIVRRYAGNSNLQMSFPQRESKRGYAVEFEEMVQFIMLNLPAAEEITVQRRHVGAYPEVAIRELLANALVHQDFNISGMLLTVEIFSNRVVITNPGAPLNDIARLIDMPPLSRNEKLAQTMFLLRLCERRGSGMDRAMEAIEAMHLPAPNFSKGDHFTRITLFPQRLFNEMTKAEKIQACYYHACLQYEKGQPTTNQSVRTRFNLDKKESAKASRTIADTVEAGYIKLSDTASQSRKFATYIPHYA